MSRRSKEIESQHLPPAEWQDFGSCRHIGGDLFFPPFDVEPTAARIARENQAKAVCAECPVRLECLEFALSMGEPHGVWGGYSESERRDLRIGRRQAS